MRVLYISGLCTRAAYEELIPVEGDRTSQQLQKFAGLLVDGLTANGVDVSVFSRPPINRRNNKRLVIHRQPELDGGVHFHYQVIINLPVIRHLVTFIGVFFYTLRVRLRERNVAVLCDPMAVTSFFAARLATKLVRTSLIALVTDAPSVYAGDATTGVSLPMRVSSSLIRSADGYVFVTEQMNALINTRNRPFVVMEGMVDTRWSERSCSKSANADRDLITSARVCLYAGGLREQYGVMRFVRAFTDLSPVGWELHIYGGGPDADSIVESCDKYPAVRYFGVRNNADVVQAQASASLLVNPRLTEYDYVKYSFPSKLLEYLSSGTPTLTTRLAGIPPEYDDYLLYFEDESRQGMEAQLRSILSGGSEELSAFGMRARTWVLEQKNSKRQAGRVVHLLNLLCGSSNL